LPGDAGAVPSAHELLCDNALASDVPGLRTACDDDAITGEWRERACPFRSPGSVLSEDMSVMSLPFGHNGGYLKSFLDNAW